MSADINGAAAGRARAPRALIWLLLMSGAIAWSRYHYLKFPLTMDPSSFCVIAHEMLHGKRLYVDLFDHKPPAIYFVNALAELIAGYGDWQIWLLGSTAAIGTLFAIYWAGAGLWGCLFWTVVQADAYTQANAPFAEIWVALFAILGFAAARHHRPWLAATMLLIACLFKPTAIFFAPAYLFALPRGGPIPPAKPGEPETVDWTERYPVCVAASSALRHPGTEALP